MAREGKFLGTLLVADMLRPEATKAIRDLKAMGLRTVLLTGDAKAVAENIGRKLGTSNAFVPRLGVESFYEGQAFFYELVKGLSGASK